MWFAGMWIVLSVIAAIVIAVTVGKHVTWCWAYIGAAFTLLAAVSSALFLYHSFFLSSPGSDSLPCFVCLSVCPRLA